MFKVAKCQINLKFETSTFLFWAHVFSLLWIPKLKTQSKLSSGLNHYDHDIDLVNHI